MVTNTAKTPEKTGKPAHPSDSSTETDKATAAKESLLGEFVAEGKHTLARSKERTVNGAEISPDGKTYNSKDLHVTEEHNGYTLHELVKGKIDQTLKLDAVKREAQFLNKDNKVLYELNGVDKFARHLLTKNRAVYQLSGENIDEAMALDEKLKRQSKTGELPEERIYVSANGDMAIFTKDANQQGKDIKTVIRKHDRGDGGTDVRVNDGELQKFGKHGGYSGEGFQFTDKDGSKLPVTILRDELKVGDTTVKLLARELSTKSDQGAVTILSGDGKSIVDRKGLIQVSVDGKGFIRNLSSDASLFKSFDTNKGIIEGSTKSGRTYTIDLGDPVVHRSSSVTIVDRDHFKTIMHRGGTVTAFNSRGTQLFGFGPTQGLVPGIPKLVDHDDDSDSEDKDTGKEKTHSTTELAGTNEASGLLTLAQGAVNPESLKGLLFEYYAMFANRARIATDKGNLAAANAYSQSSSEVLAAADILARKSNETRAA